MALYDENGNPVQQRSFLGGIGDFLLGALKWLAIAALTVTGIAAVMHFLPGVKDWTDKVSGDNKLGSKLDDTLSGAWDKIKGLFTGGSDYKKVSAESVSTVVTAADGNPLLVPKADAFNKDDLKKVADLSDRDKKIAAINSPNATAEQRQKGQAALDDAEKIALNFAGKLDAWNSKAHDFKSPVQPPEIPFNTKPLPTDLAEYGASTIKNWETMVPLQQIDVLDKHLKQLTKSTPDPDYKLSASGSTTEYLFPNVIHVLDYTHLINEADATMETVRKKRLRNILGDGDYAKAQSEAKDAQKVFELQAKESGKNDKYYDQYVSAAKDFEKIADFANNMRMNQALEPIKADAFKAIGEAAKALPAQMDQYNEELKKYKESRKEDKKVAMDSNPLVPGNFDVSNIADAGKVLGSLGMTDIDPTAKITQAIVPLNKGDGNKKNLSGDTISAIV